LFGQLHSYTPTCIKSVFFRCSSDAFASARKEP
jgi:hypothetical protein